MTADGKGVRFDVYSEDAVEHARKHEEWRTEYMTLQMRDNEMKEKGRKEERIESVRNMLKYGVPKEKILMDYTEDNIERDRK